jgi:hypothetical protein
MITSIRLAVPSSPASSVAPPPGASAPLPPTSASPRTDVSSTFVVDVTEAARLATAASDMLAGVPRDDVGAESTKDLRIRIYKTNMAAQSRIERQFDAGNPMDVVSALRTADASLEDANWQLAKKPSPDGRFNGVDVPGAVRDTATGVELLDKLLASAGGVPSTPSGPSTPPPVDPPVPGDGGIPVDPPGVPSTPPPPPAPPAPPVEPDEPTSPSAPTPPSAPTQTPPSTLGTPDGDYPGEDEFPKGTPAGDG